MLVISCNSQKQSTPVVISDEDAEDLTNIKIILLPKAYDEQDTVLLDQLLHEKYQLVDDGGLIYSKNDEIKYVSQYGSSYDALSFEIKKMEIFENGTAMIFGTGSINGQDIQGAYSLSYQSTDIFVKGGKGWRAISSHVSGVKEVRE